MSQVDPFLVGAVFLAAAVFLTALKALEHWLVRGEEMRTEIECGRDGGVGPLRVPGSPE